MGKKTFDDTYWGIETYAPSVDDDGNLLLMIPIEELKQRCIPHIAAWHRLLMIPIEELKPTRWNDFTIMCMLLMIPIEELKLVPAVRWELAQNLLMIPIEELKLEAGKLNMNCLKRSFWWYLLRNWNACLILIVAVCERLLMIPIEELKHLPRLP